jgi:hypothetical protein
MRWVGHVMHMREMRNVQKILVVLLGRSKSSYEDNTKMDLRTSGFCGLNPKPTFCSPCYKMLILNFNYLPCSHFLFSSKVVSFKVVYPLKIYQNTKFHGTVLTGASFTSTSKV